MIIGVKDDAPANFKEAYEHDKKMNAELWEKGLYTWFKQWFGGIKIGEKKTTIEVEINSLIDYEDNRNSFCACSASGVDVNFWEFWNRNDFIICQEDSCVHAKSHVGLQ